MTAARITVSTVDLCVHTDEEDGPPHASEGRLVYSDGSSHPCCREHVRRYRGLAHGPGTFVPWGEIP